MTDKEQIADIQKIIEYCCNEYDEKGRHVRNLCNPYDCEYYDETNGVCCSFSLKEAIALYKQGYRKISEGSVVLSKEEHKQLYNDERASYYRAENLAIENDLLNRKLIDARKETAEKFVNLPDSDILVVNTQEYGEIEVVSVERLQELAKQFGVDS